MSGPVRHWRSSAGIQSLEFALAFPVFVLVLYAVIVYSLVFAAQQTLIQAAAEGARAALRYGTTAERVAVACAVATSSTSWITSTVGAAPSCSVSTDCANAPCRRVRMVYDYRARPLVPTPPLMDSLVPDTLQADAIVHFNP